MFDELAKILVDNNIPFLVIPEGVGTIRITFDNAVVVVKSSGTAFLTAGDDLLGSNMAALSLPNGHPLRKLATGNRIRKEYGRGDAKDLFDDYSRL